MKRTIAHVAAAAGMLAMLAACTPKDDQTQVRERATERWNLLIAGKGDQAYDYLTPGYRQTVTREDYKRRVTAGAVRWKAASPQEVNCGPESCAVKMSVQSTLTVPQAARDVNLDTPVKENWVKVDSNWYYLPDSGLDRAAKVPEPGAPAPAPNGQ